MDNYALWATSDYSVGVFGEGGDAGVRGVGFYNGVEGQSETGRGVWARSERGFALVVSGVAQFSTAGNGTVPAAQDSAFVGHSAVTAKSHITVTLTGSPRTAAAFPPLVLWVERQPGIGFIVHLTRTVGRATPFSYLIVEPES